jgi:hypothetical protein
MRNTYGSESPSRLGGDVPSDSDLDNSDGSSALGLALAVLVLTPMR